ncbi:MAG: fasciclin domain-containing protein [Anaerolineales bacterium]
MRKLTLLTLVVVLALASFAAPVSAQTEENNNTIVDIAVGNSNFSILATAVVTAGLADTLSSGEYTVFAPTNAAFARLLERLNVTQEELLADEDALRDILLYHVVPNASVRAGDIPGLFDSSGQAFVEMANGNRTSLAVDQSTVYINGVRVTSANIEASNGVIHAIEDVILPPSNLVATAQARNTGQFDSLLAAATAAGLVDTLSNGGPFTVLAPTDDAFTALLNTLGLTFDELAANEELLTSVLTYHVIPGTFYSGDITAAVDGQGTFEVPTVNGDTITVTVNGGFINVDSASVIAKDIVASNGVIHVINQVILPE